MADDRILEIRDLHVQFQTSESLVQAVDGVSMAVRRGHTLGIVGESGSGKSVTALAILGLIPQPPGRIAGGSILFWDHERRDGDRPNSERPNSERPNSERPNSERPNSDRPNSDHPNSERPHSGRLEPVDLTRLGAEQLRHYRGGRIALISQEPMSALNPVYTCGFQMVEAIRLHQDVSEAEARRRAIALFQEVKLLPSDAELGQRWDTEAAAASPQPVNWDGSPGDVAPDSAPLTPAQERQRTQFINRQKQAMLDRYPHQLSGGQLQRVAIAMAISCDPALLIADEPTTALDVTVQARILDLLRELRDRRGMSLIFVTHDLGTIAEIADDVAVMYQGKIVETGSVLDIFAQPQHPYTRGLLTCRPRPDRQLRYLPTVADFLAQNHDHPQDTPRSLDALLADTIPPQERTQRLATLQAQSPLLQVHDLRVAFPVRGMFGQARRYFMAVNGVSFDVYPGETLGLVGESGCGKSTLARAVLRLIEPTSGSILLDGIDLLAQRGRALRKLRRDMQIVFQDPYSSLDPRMSIGAAVMEPTRVHGAGQSYQVHRDRAAYLLERVGIDPAWMNRYPHEFSGGQRQRICIARALALNPRFIICDESVSALDVSVQAQVLNLLKALQAEFGLTYIFISHDLSVVKFMSDRILVMNQGRIEELGPADQVYAAPQRDYTRQLIAAIPQDSLEAIRQRQAARSQVA
jgi:peptide/nickel transport system ATP-binding protein